LTGACSSIVRVMNQVVGKPAVDDVERRREFFLRAGTFAFLGALLVGFWSAVTLAVVVFSRGLL
jgi:hypothetical protein